MSKMKEMTTYSQNETLMPRLRGMIQKLRRTPMPISDVVPMLIQAADKIEELEAEVVRLRKDAEYLDWLALQYVEVRIPLRYGSKECFCSSPDDDDGELVPWDIRTKIGKALSAKG